MSKAIVTIIPAKITDVERKKRLKQIKQLAIRLLISNHRGTRRVDKKKLP